MGTIQGRETADNRVLKDSDYFLPTSYVDRFAGDVSQRKAPPVDSEAHQHEMDEGEGDLGGSGDPTDGEIDKGVSDCARNWKAAAPDEKKSMWAIFDETGVFVAACRHGLILWIVDMIKSGEL